MTTHESQPTEQKPLVVAPTLPFAYEDRSDGRYQRLRAEVEAARAWSLRRRASGLAPN